ncbi:MAG TPA: sodium-dependent bicarbonate transport family permease [Candidatus Nanopelagicales bacterium]|nr:sodium-dependent bicarbonate transport family permease [Candidatus Nanopelagicales bacterium]
MSAELLTTSIASVPVLAFVLGVVGALLRADLRLPDAVYQATSIYLLLAIGIKGGVALRESDVVSVAAPAMMTIALGVLIPILAFSLLRVMTRLDVTDRGAMAAHYGSTSLVTFTAALVFLDSLGVSYEGFVSTLLAIMEIPGILVGLLLAGSAARHSGRLSETVREILTSRSILLLAGGLVMGFITGPEGFARVEPFFGAPFTGVLALFLLEMGVLAGRRLGDVRRAGVGLVAFAIGFPVLAGALGVAGGTVVGLSPGGAMVLGVLSASASYIAAPAAVRLALPQANPGLTLTSSLGITFPFNLIVGIPLYWLMADWLATMIGG